MNIVIALLALAVVGIRRRVWLLEVRVENLVRERDEAALARVESAERDRQRAEDEQWAKSWAAQRRPVQ